MRKWVLISLLIFSVGLVTAQIDILGFYEDDKTLNLISPDPPTNYSLIPTVNSSNYWDNLNTINTTQMQESSGVLNILESWINSFWCSLTGCEISGDFNVTGNATVEGIKFEVDNTHRIYDNSTCIIIEGDTSDLYVC